MKVLAVLKHRFIPTKGSTVNNISNEALHHYSSDYGTILSRMVLTYENMEGDFIGCLAESQEYDIDKKEAGFMFHMTFMEYTWSCDKNREIKLYNRELSI